MSKHYLPLLPIISLQRHVPRQICLTVFVEEKVPARGFSFTSKGDLWNLKRQHCQLRWQHILQKYVDEVESTNQLVEACKIYLSSEPFIAELEYLAYFNHFIIFAFLNFVETSTQAKLLVILPQLYSNLSGRKLRQWKILVSIHGMSAITLSSEASRKIIDMMCLYAAATINLQCSREYSFSDEEKLRARDLSSLTVEELNDLSTNIITSECNLSRFDREARVGKNWNWRFKEKYICNNMVLYKNETNVKIDKMSQKLSILFSNRETSWNIGWQEKL